MSSHISEYFNHSYQKRWIKKLEKAILSEGIEFDFVAVTGISGLMAAQNFCFKHGIELVVVRKNGVKTHSSRNIEYSDSLWEKMKKYNAENKILNYIIIDDCIDSGDTVLNIKKQISKGFPCGTELRGVFVNYNYYDTRSIIGVSHFFLTIVSLCSLDF